jgi:hypothetical protein
MAASELKFDFVKEEFMRVMTAFGLILLLSMSGLAQSTTATAVYQEGSAFLDSSGSLIVIDNGRSTTGVTITGQRHSFFAPKTRITILPKGAAVSSTPIEYDGSVQVIGVGSSAIYAIATIYTVSGTTLTTAQSLIAIRSSLPAGPALTGFPSFNLTGPVEARAGQSDDFIWLTSRSSASSRTAAVLHFTGTAFEQTSSGTLP